MATNLRSPDARYVFRSMGMEGKFHAFRAPIWSTVNRGSLDAQQFEAEVAGWLCMNTSAEWHVSSFKKTPGYQDMPFALKDGASLCVLLESKSDVIAFEQAFEVNV